MHTCICIGTPKGPSSSSAALLLLSSSLKVASMCKLADFQRRANLCSSSGGGVLVLLQSSAAADFRQNYACRSSGELRKPRACHAKPSLLLVVLGMAWQASASAPNGEFEKGCKLVLLHIIDHVPKKDRIISLKAFKPGYIKRESSRGKSNTTYFVHFSTR